LVRRASKKKSKKKIKAAFLDRDGVINHDYGHVGTIERFDFVENVFTALKKISNQGFKIFIITNQAGIAKKKFSLKNYHTLTSFYLNILRSNNIFIEEVVFCPHHPNGFEKKYTGDCDYRKPNPGMINYLKEKHNISLSESFLIGDNLTDIEAGINAGIKKLFLIDLNGKHKADYDMPIDGVYSNLYEFSKTL